MVFVRVATNEPIAQGDIIDDCPVLFWASSGDGSDQAHRVATSSRRILILTQACDLAQEKATRVLTAIVHSADDLVTQGVLTAGMVRDQIRRHRVYGWYFLPRSELIEESLVDLRDLHTVPRKMLEGLIHRGKRVCRIGTPFREHIAQHFSITYSRIGLPAPYDTEES